MSKRESLLNQAYVALKQAIIKGEYQPGEKLKESKLAEKLGISRTPIREALRRLELEGLITYIPLQGAQVASLNREMIISLYECRISLEALAARKAAANISQSQLDQIEESIILAKQFFQNGNIEKTAEKNTQFHNTIMHASQNMWLIQLMEQIETQIVRFRTITSEYGFRETFVEEHEEIYRALLERNADRAEMLMKQHIERELETILRRLHDSRILS